MQGFEVFSKVFDNSTVKKSVTSETPASANVSTHQTSGLETMSTMRESIPVDGDLKESNHSKEGSTVNDSSMESKLEEDNGWVKV